MNELNIIPKPVSGVIEGGSIDLAIVKTIALMHNSDDEKKTAVYLKELLQPVSALAITDFEKNKSYRNDDLTKRIKESKENLINLKLFNFVEINKKETQDTTQIAVDVIERWYIWPYPVFEISERNFNTWWKEFSANNYSDFSRLNYGLFLNWENFRGRNELLKLKIRKGFKEHYLLVYNVPYFNKNKTIGINTALGVFKRKKSQAFVLVPTAKPDSCKNPGLKLRNR